MHIQFTYFKPKCASDVIEKFKYKKVIVFIMPEYYTDKVSAKVRSSRQEKDKLASSSDKAVKSGRSVLITRAVATNLTGETQRILIGATKQYANHFTDASFDTTKSFEGPIKANSACEATKFPLEEGEVVGAIFEGVTEGDELLLTVVGEYIK